MENLNYQTLEKLGYAGYLKRGGSEKVLQFGEGNFLRAFVDYFFDVCNEKGTFDGRIVLVQPIAPGLAGPINAQQGLYTLYLRGRENGEKVDRKRVISSVSRCINPYADYAALLECAHNPELEYIVSNTTEAGIVYDPVCGFDDAPPASFPAKLTRFLYERYTAFAGAADKGLVVLSCELIDNNGKELEKCVGRYIAQWGLDAGFAAWVDRNVLFCSTLVDRIVPGRVRDAKLAAEMEAANGYHDELIDVGECFGVWVIEGPAWLEEKLPFAKAGCNVQVVPDVTPYKKRKVRILNGAHTSMVLGAYLAGFDIVRDCMQDEVICAFMNKTLNEEVIPTLPLPRADLEAFAAAVKDRFNNPFVDHELLSISLNSTSKWKARCLPSMQAYIEAQGRLPACLTMSLAACIAFYSSDIQGMENGRMICRRPAGNTYAVQDDAWVLDFYCARKNASAAELARDVLANTQMWDTDLTAVPGLLDAVTADLEKIRAEGARAAYAACL